MTVLFALAVSLAVSAVGASPTGSAPVGASPTGSAPVGAPSGGAPDSGCVTCHRVANGGAVSGHSVDEWERSGHARAGVECQDCHGGDGAAAVATAAHQGLHHSGDPRSPLYFKNLPALCGTCHAEEFAAFKRSKHYGELQRTGRGANCVTCHGAMATAIPTGGFLQGTCGACHEQPLKVYEALRDIRQTRRVVSRMREVLKRAEAAKVATAADRQEAVAVGGLYETAQHRWHEFRMAEIQDDLHLASRRAGQLAGELDLRLKKPAAGARGAK